MKQREYLYVGPAKIRESARSQPVGTSVATRNELRQWLESAPEERTTQDTWIVTFTVSIDGDLHLASRRSEHIACAGYERVLSAGEITFDDELVVIEITNQSTGFCPEPESWNAVVSVLDRIKLIHPGRFTTEVVFRLCPTCGQRNIVRDSWFHCAICDGKLPLTWNFASSKDMGEQSDARQALDRPS
jgi:hypothetical protein